MNSRHENDVSCMHGTLIIDIKTPVKRVKKITYFNNTEIV